MDFNLPSDIKLVQQSSREFATEVIAPHVEKMEQTGEFPEGLISEMAVIGLLGLIVPREYGGAGLGYLARTVALAEISRVSAAIGVSLQCHHMQIAGLLEWADEAQKKTWLPSLCNGDYLGVCAVTEPTGGSDLMGMASTATAIPGGYSLTGRKCFITNSHLAGAPLVFAKTGEGPRGLSAFVVKRGGPGYSLGRHENKLGLRGANTGELFFTDCFVPAGNMVGSEGEGMKIALRTISETGRPGMAAVALGIIEACLDEAVAFARQRTLYGKPISNLQAIQWNIADIMVALETSRLLCFKASWLKDQKRDSSVAMTMAKTVTTEAAVQSAKKAIEIHGGCGTMMEYPVQRYFRDAMVCISAGGTAEIGKIVLSRAALS